MDSKKRYHTAKFYTLLIILSIVLIVSIIMTLSLGAMKITSSDTYRIILHKLFNIADSSIAELQNSSIYNIIWKIRFPRVILGVFVGAGLSLCGAVMQATVQNPLAEPYILGISSGASLGATISILLGSSFSLLLFNQSIFLFAFIGAILASVCVLLLSSAGSSMTTSKLVLSGMVVNALFTAISNFVISLVGNDSGIMSIKFWTLGSLTRANWDNILLPIVVVTICIVFFLLQYRPLNTMLLGDEAAITLGINLSFYRKLYMILTSVLTGVLVATCGIIGFVGLMIPHIVRSLVGPDHRRLLPIATLLGAIFLVWADAFARIIIPNSELAIGIITSLIGAPFFVYIMIKRSYRFGG
jgi:iron complex transport system permease protein